MVKERAQKTACSLFLIVVLTIVLTLGCDQKENTADPNVSAETANWLEEAAKAKDAEIAKAEIEAARRTKLAAEKNRLAAEKEKIIAEQKAIEEAERIRVYPARLAEAEAEVEKATLTYNEQSEKAETTKRVVLASQSRLRTMEGNIETIKSKQAASEADLHTITSSLGKALSQAERSLLLQRQKKVSGDLRGLTIKEASAKNSIESEKARLAVREEELKTTEIQLQETQDILKTAIDRRDKIKNEGNNKFSASPLI